MFGIEPEGAVYEAGEHLVKGKSASGQDAVYPGIGIEEFAYCVYDKHGTADFAHELLDFPGHQFFAGDFFHEGYHEHGEHGACADGGKQIEEEGPRPDKEAVAENVGAAEENAVHTAEAALVESGKKSAYAGEKRHINVEVMGYVLDKFIFFKCTLFEDKRHIFDNKHYAVAGNAENNFREHGVHVGVPVAEPAPERLADVQYENEHGARVAQKADNGGKAYDVFEFIDIQDIAEQAGEKGTCAEGDDRKVDGNPQAEPEFIVKPCCSKPVCQHHESGNNAPKEQCRGDKHKKRELGKGTTFTPFGEKGIVNWFAVIHSLSFS